jgi:hypothetical protein
MMSTLVLKRSARIGAVTLVALSVTWAGATASTGTKRYRGHIGPDRKSHVTVKVKANGKLRFEADRVHIYCDDLSDFHYSPPPVTGQLDQRDRFQGVFAQSDSRDDYQVFFYADGRVKADHADGRLFLFFNGGGDAPRCNTSAALPWSAKR